MPCKSRNTSLPAANKSSLTQQQLLRQRLLPQQLRLVALVEKTDEEIEREIAAELDANPALERTPSDDAPRYWHRTPSAGDSDDFRPVQADTEPTLADTLLDQLAEVQTAAPEVRPLAAYIIGALDPNGYLTRTLPQLQTDLALSLGTQPQPDHMRAAYDLVRGLDPAGVGAQDLRDCLLLQLRRLDPERPDVADALELITHYFDLYSLRNRRKLTLASGLSAERLDAADTLIKSLNPKPGAAFSSDPTLALGNSAVTPDFTVETDGERLTVSMANSLPELQIEESFRADDAAAGDAAAFIREQRSRARSFIEMLERRTKTLMAIARAIVQIQAPFFLNGDDESRIRPMVLRQVADATGLDLSLVSRAVSGKWLATPWGVYPLKSFFNHRSGADDDETSAREIGAAMREIVAAEPADAPLSDEAIAAALADRGYKVARRTVAKYRTRLGIPAARLRKH